MCIGVRRGGLRGFVAAVVAAAMVLGGSPVAWADPEQTSNDPTSQSISWTTSTSSGQKDPGSQSGSEASSADLGSSGAVTGIVLVAALVSVTLTAVGIGLTVTLSMDRGTKRRVALYLERNRSAVMQATAVGGNETVEDLAQLLQFPAVMVSGMGRVMRSRGEGLRASLGEVVDTEGFLATLTWGLGMDARTAAILVGMGRLKFGVRWDGWWSPSVSD